MRIFKIVSLCMLMLVLITGSPVVAMAAQPTCSDQAVSTYNQTLNGLWSDYQSNKITIEQYLQAATDALNALNTALDDCNDATSNG